MVAHFSMRTNGVYQAFWFVRGIGLHLKSCQIRFFSKKKTYFTLHVRNMFIATNLYKSHDLEEESIDQISKCGNKRIKLYIYRFYSSSFPLFIQCVTSQIRAEPSFFLDPANRRVMSVLHTCLRLYCLLIIQSSFKPYIYSTLDSYLLELKFWKFVMENTKKL